MKKGAPLHCHQLIASFKHGLQKLEGLGLSLTSVFTATVWISRQRPAVPYGLTGLLGMTLTLQTGQKDAHSGVTGGPARNPMGKLCQL